MKPKKATDGSKRWLGYWKRAVLVKRMAKVNKLALTRMALRMTLNQLDDRELLCVLADMYTGGGDKELPRWYGNGNGTNGLEQGIYNYMTTFRRVSNLWTKLMQLHGNDKEKLKLETYRVRDYVLKRLDEKGVDLKEIEETNE
jgi:hypothetical protein